MRAIVSEETDEKHEALRAAYENIERAGPHFGTRTKPENGASSARSARGTTWTKSWSANDAVSSYKTTTYGVEEIRDYENAEEATRALEYQKEKRSKAVN